jgi:hypothetical protein
MIKDVEKIANYYNSRYYQFRMLEKAVNYFKFKRSNADSYTWAHLFEYALHKEEADKMFDLLDDKTIDMLAGFKVSFVICIADE